MKKTLLFLVAVVCGSCLADTDEKVMNCGLPASLSFDSQKPASSFEFSLSFNPYKIGKQEGYGLESYSGEGFKYDLVIDDSLEPYGAKILRGTSKKDSIYAIVPERKNTPFSLFMIRNGFIASLICEM